MSLTEALCHVAGQAQPQVIREINRARESGSLTNQQAAQLRRAMSSALEMLCSGQDMRTAQTLASELGVTLVRAADGQIYVTVGEPTPGGPAPSSTPDSTKPPPSGGYNFEPKRPGGANFEPKPSGGACCRSCGMGGACETDCPKFDHDDESDDAACGFIDEDTPPPVPSTIPMLPPGFWNCKRYADKLAPCTIRKIKRSRRRWVVTADTSLGTFVQVTWDGDGALSPPAGYAYYRLVLEAVNVSHFSCPRSFEVRNRAGNIVTIEDVAIAAEKLYVDPQGNFVLAWDFPKPEDPDYIKITDGRCECAQLCTCVPAEARLALYVLLPVLPTGDKYVARVKGKRNRWCRPCGECPPALICEREKVDACKPCDCTTTPPTTTPAPTT